MKVKGGRCESVRRKQSATQPTVIDWGVTKVKWSEREGLRRGPRAGAQAPVVIEGAWSGVATV